jgi:hypothetical protein
MEVIAATLKAGFSQLASGGLSLQWYSSITLPKKLTRHVSQKKMIQVFPTLPNLRC